MRVVLISILIFVGIFSVVSVVFYFGDWVRLGAVSAMGLFVGLVAAPELDRKAFKSPKQWQLFSGAAFGGLLGFVLSGESQVIIACCIIFALIGVTASSWLRHLPVP